MKALTNKIFDAIAECRDEQFNEFTKRQLDRLLGEVIKIEAEAEFEEVARVVMKHLGNGDKYHPHITVIITGTRAEALEGINVVDEVFEYVND
jgi:hypothetical protein